MPPMEAAYSAVRSNQEVLERARQSIAGGDNSTMRVLSYHAPLVAERGQGCRVWDVEGREYIDLNMAYGPLLFGHRPPAIVQAVVNQLQQSGSQLGFPQEISVRVAEKLRQLFPTMQRMRFSSTGTEAVASAVRLARGVTGRPIIIAFEGHYHGWNDVVFHRYHAPLDDLPNGDYGPALPGTLGMNGAPHNLLVVRWNDLAALERCLIDHRGQVAAVVMEPIMGNAGVIPPDPQFLAGARELVQDEDALLIFDEVITGLRVGPGGAQGLYGIYPDITIVSKALGGGFPISAFGASPDIMNAIERGEVFHGGVYSGNALVMAAAEAVLDAVRAGGDRMYEDLNQISDRFSAGLDDVLSRHSVPHQIQHVGPMISCLLTDDAGARPLVDYRAVRRHGDAEKYIRLQHAMQAAGVYYHPNHFEPMYLSTAHTWTDLANVLDRFEDCVRCCLVT